ncbi:MAG: 50S ribosomal protein L30 [Candidatus Marinimicrobia bacterium]|nr:50S ribosomal protein L30 [Candidatus Neomarinimicrobiota bacterium]
MAKNLKITQVKSGIGYRQRTKDTLRALGFRRMHQTVEQPDNPAIRGMIKAVRHLVKVDES